MITAGVPHLMETSEDSPRSDLIFISKGMLQPSVGFVACVLRQWPSSLTQTGQYSDLAGLAVSSNP
jgi:hypothetical protein